MFLAEKTVKNYVSSLLAKLGLERRTQAAVFATKHAAAEWPASGADRVESRTTLDGARPALSALPAHTARGRVRQLRDAERRCSPSSTARCRRTGCSCSTRSHGIPDPGRGGARDVVRRAGHAPQPGGCPTSPPGCPCVPRLFADHAAARRRRACTRGTAASTGGCRWAPRSTCCRRRSTTCRRRGGLVVAQVNRVDAVDIRRRACCPSTRSTTPSRSTSRSARPRRVEPRRRAQRDRGADRGAGRRTAPPCRWASAWCLTPPCPG